MRTETSPSARRGGAWLVDATSPDDVFTPEHLTDEHRLIAQTADEFVEQEVLPKLDELERKNWTLARDLVRRCGELGLIGVDVPESFGGVGLDKITSIIVSERLARSASFGATFGGQANLAVVPIFMFGTADQKQRYLPRLTSGALIGAYALSESGSGSDALGARASAARQDDGSYVLNGEKMWITNGGFADLFIVFAKVGGEQFSAFIVERAFPGVGTGKEEHKMGLHGSSTTPLILQDVRVPAANLLGEIGKGHKVAFNVLNFGRLKLGAMCTGGARFAIAESAKYAAQRKQFGRAIATFGAIKHKLGEMTVRTYAVESLLYRTAGSIDRLLEDASKDGAPLLAALEEFAVEASIAKVSGSETLDFVVDENVQIHGGNGFVHDYPAERHYRDARVNRIFEGTNEINRLLIPTLLIRRAGKGDGATGSSQPTPTGVETPLGAQSDAVTAFRRATRFVMSQAVRKFGEKLSEEQEILTALADMVIDTFAADSAVLRAQHAAIHRASNASLHADAVRIFVNDAASRIDVNARQALATITSGDSVDPSFDELRGWLSVSPLDTVQPRRRLADETVARGSYIFAG